VNSRDEIITDVLNRVDSRFPVFRENEYLVNELNIIAAQRGLSAVEVNAVQNLQLIGQHLDQAIIPEQERADEESLSQGKLFNNLILPTRVNEIVFQPDTGCNYGIRLSLDWEFLSFHLL
jgi:hypothetical protein